MEWQFKIRMVAQSVYVANDDDDNLVWNMAFHNKFRDLKGRVWCLAESHQENGKMHEKWVHYSGDKERGYSMEAAYEKEKMQDAAYRYNDYASVRHPKTPNNDMPSEKRYKPNNDMCLPKHSWHIGATT